VKALSFEACAWRRQEGASVERQDGSKATETGREMRKHGEGRRERTEEKVGEEGGEVRRRQKGGERKREGEKKRGVR
jgi:hypothetical protein